MPEFEEVVTGEAEVREVFRIKGVGLVAGCLVQNGVIKRNDKVRFLRDGTVIWHGTLTSLLPRVSRIPALVYNAGPFGAGEPIPERSRQHRFQSVVTR